MPNRVSRRAQRCSLPGVRPLLFASTMADPPKPAPTAAELVRKWASRIDHMDYFQILRVERPQGVNAWPAEAELRKAFATFASSFHPDRYRHEPQDVQALATMIFRRGNEALRVLLNPGLRARYIRHLASGKMRLEGEEATRSPTTQFAAVRPEEHSARTPGSSPPSMRTAAGSIEALVRHPAAIQFAKEAESLLARNEPKKALFALQMVQSKEPDNIAIREWIAMLTEQVKKK
jgi:curved DNA-binding protein CbpA